MTYKLSVDEQFYKDFLCILDDAYADGATCWDDLPRVMQDKAAHVYLRSDLGSELVADCQELNVRLASMFDTPHPRPSDVGEAVKFALRNDIGSHANKYYFCKVLFVNNED